MKTRMMAVAVALAMASSAASTLLAQSATLGGTAKDEAKRPFTDYTVRARDAQGTVGATQPLDAQGNFTLSSLASTRYVVELVDKNGKVVCTEGPFDMAAQATKSDVNIDCNKVPAAWWLLGAAAAAGVTAGVVAAGDASPSR
jgi:hypothetical protein